MADQPRIRVSPPVAPLTREKTVGTFSGGRDEMEDDWKVVRILNGGTRALREAGPEFTPRTAREEKNETLYTNRLAMTVLFDVYNETVEKIAGLAFEKPPALTGQLPEPIDAIEQDADLCGTPLATFLAWIHQDAVDRGFGLFLVDNVPTYVDEPTGETDDEGNAVTARRTMSIAEARANNARPYFSRIKPDNLVGWDVEMRGGREVCTELRVREWRYVKNGDGQDELTEFVRVYTGTTVEVWRRDMGTASVAESRAMLGDDGDHSAFILDEAAKPTGFPNGEIPLVVHYTRKIDFLIAAPPLLPLAHLNIKHWNQQSVLDTTLRYNQAPTLFGKGFARDDLKSKPQTGEGSTLLTTSTDAELGYVEISGESLKIAQAEIEKTERRMNAEKVVPLQAGQVTATGEMRAEMDDQSPAQRWITSCEHAAYRGFELAAAWRGVELPEDFNIALHRKSSVLALTNPQRTSDLREDYKNSLITRETYLIERARGGDFGDDFDPQEEAARLDEKDVEKAEQQMQMLAERIKAERPKPGEKAEKGGDKDEPDDDKGKLPGDQVS